MIKKPDKIIRVSFSMEETIAKKLDKISKELEATKSYIIAKAIENEYEELFNKEGEKKDEQ